MFTTVVVPIDGSALSRLALPVAATVAGAAHASVRLVAVARGDDELASSHERLQEAARSLSATTSAELEVLVDADPVAALLRIADDADNVLCFGSHDHTHPVAELLGSVGTQVAERSANPYIIVGPNGTPASAGRDVVVALDGGDSPDRLLATAVAWALHLGAPLRVVTVYEPVPDDVRAPGHFTRRHGPPTDPDVYLEAMRRRADDPGLDGVTSAAIPDPVSVADGLAAHLAHDPAFILVVGGGHRHLRPTSLTRDLLRGSPPPVLVANGTTG